MFHVSGKNLGTGFQRTLGEIDLLTAVITFVGFVKLIGKYLFLRAAIRTVADKRFQVLKLLKSRAMLWCGHNFLLTVFGS